MKLIPFALIERPLALVWEASPICAAVANEYVSVPPSGSDAKIWTVCAAPLVKCKKGKIAATGDDCDLLGFTLIYIKLM